MGVKGSSSSAISCSCSGVPCSGVAGRSTVFLVSSRRTGTKLNFEHSESLNRYIFPVILSMTGPLNLMHFRSTHFPRKRAANPNPNRIDMSNRPVSVFNNREILNMRLAYTITAYLCGGVFEEYLM